MKDYKTARAEAQKRANETGHDHGIELNKLFREYMIYMLPQRQHRTGHELRCEVVMPEGEKCYPGHGCK